MTGRNPDLSVVIDHDPSLLSQLRDWPLVIKMKTYGDIELVYSDVAPRNRIVCFALSADCPLDDVAPIEKLQKVPISLSVPEVGDLRKVFQRLDRYRDCTTRFILPATKQENIRDARILSSLGISTGLLLPRDASRIDWEAVQDLLCYDVYGKVPHAPIQPFSRLVTAYNPRGITLVTSCYFEDPSVFVHMDSELNIALGAEQLASREFIGKGLADLTNLCDNNEYRKQLSRREEFFLSGIGLCSSCPNWRLCQGAFVLQCRTNDACRAFFDELLEAAESFRQRDLASKDQFNARNHLQTY
jgi:hypothetical protein